MRFHIFKCDRYEKSCRGGSGAATMMKAAQAFHDLAIITDNMNNAFSDNKHL